ncbi:MAG TPA: hypothetical protein VIH11_08825 [Gemmatimonadaceae bacterium]
MSTLGVNEVTAAVREQALAAAAEALAKIDSPAVRVLAREVMADLARLTVRAISGIPVEQELRIARAAYLSLTAAGQLAVTAGMRETAERVARVLGGIAGAALKGALGV